MALALIGDIAGLAMAALLFFSFRIGVFGASAGSWGLAGFLGGVGRGAASRGVGLRLALATTLPGGMGRGKKCSELAGLAIAAAASWRRVRRGGKENWLVEEKGEVEGEVGRPRP